MSNDKNNLFTEYAELMFLLDVFSAFFPFEDPTTKEILQAFFVFEYETISKLERSELYLFLSIFCFVQNSLELDESTSPQLMQQVDRFVSQLFEKLKLNKFFKTEEVHIDFTEFLLSKPDNQKPNLIFSLIKEFLTSYPFYINVNFGNNILRRHFRVPIVTPNQDQKITLLISTLTALIFLPEIIDLLINSEFEIVDSILNDLLKYLQNKIHLEQNSQIKALINEIIDNLKLVLGQIDTKKFSKINFH